MEVVRTVVSERQQKLGSRVIEYRFPSKDLEDNLVLQSEFTASGHCPIRMCPHFKQHIVGKPVFMAVTELHWALRLAGVARAQRILGPKIVRELGNLAGLHIDGPYS